MLAGDKGKIRASQLFSLFTQCTRGDGSLHEAIYQSVMSEKSKQSAVSDDEVSQSTFVIQMAIIKARFPVISQV